MLNRYKFGQIVYHSFSDGRVFSGKVFSMEYKKVGGVLYGVESVNNAQIYACENELFESFDEAKKWIHL